jgi:hypothetical protein
MQGETIWYEAGGGKSRNQDEMIAKEPNAKAVQRRRKATTRNETKLEKKLKESKTQRRKTKPDEVKMEDVVYKGKSTISTRNDAQRNEIREAESEGMNEPQLRASRVKEEIVTKEDESATIRNDVVEIEIECGGTWSLQGGS